MSSCFKCKGSAFLTDISESTNMYHICFYYGLFKNFLVTDFCDFFSFRCQSSSQKTASSTTRLNLVIRIKVSQNDKTVFLSIMV